MRVLRLLEICAAAAVVASGLGAQGAAALPTVAAWGYDHGGQLGDGTNLDSDLPIAASLEPGTSVTALAAAEGHSLALLSDGTVMAWGAGEIYGSALRESDTPVAVSGLSGVTAIATSASHSLALLAGGSVMAWGGNDYGDLGDGSTKPSEAPVAVRLPRGASATAVSAGEYDSLALLSNGTVLAWGYNFSGQLGDGTTASSDLPVAVALPGGAHAIAISAGWEESTALLSDGSVIAWGNNSLGLLGDGNREGPEKCGAEGCARTPVTVQGLSGVAAISTSLDVTMALLEDGSVVSWGSNYDGQLGDRSTEASYTPVAVSGLSGVTAISSGLDVSLALLEDGTVMAWGYNGYGGLGIGSPLGPESCDGFSCSATPVAVSELSGAQAISAGADHELALGVPSPRVSTSSLPAATVGSGYRQTLGVLGGSAPYTWSLSSGSLPAGLHLNAASGAILGTPSTAGTASFTAEVSDSSAPTPQLATVELSITVLSAPEQAAEYGRCIPEKKGEYREANCQTKSGKLKRGRFEWEPGPAPTCVAVKKGRYSESKCETRDETKGRPEGRFERAPGAGFTSSSGPLTIQAPELDETELTCAAGAGTGEITGAKTGSERVTLTGCQASGKACTSEGPNATPSGEAGVIVTNMLAITPVGPVAANQVFTELVSGEHEPYLFEASCGGLLWRAIGSLGGVQKGDVNVSSLTAATSFAPGEGEQALFAELSETAGASWAGPDACTLLALASDTAAQRTEIKT